MEREGGREGEGGRVCETKPSPRKCLPGQSCFQPGAPPVLLLHVTCNACRGQ